MSLTSHDAANVRMGALRVTPVSTHGAGDMFVGALAAELDRGAALEAALEFAQYAAALHVATPPDARARIDRAAVEGFGG